MRYARALDSGLIGYLKPGGLLGFLGGDYQVLWNSQADPFALDCHLRENNQLMYYHGSTCLLTAKFYSNQTIGFRIDKAYSSLWQAELLLNRRWPFSDPCLKGACQQYIGAVMPTARCHYYRSHKEGYWQSLISVYCGLNWNPALEWLVVDREAVIGFDTGAQRDQYYRTCRHRYSPYCNQQGWSRTARYGDELDLLAIGPKCELICIELKYGGCNADKIYYGPIQASIYRDAFDGALPKIESDILEMVRQRIQIGLLPAAAAGRVPKSSFTRTRGVLAVANPRNRTECWNRLSQLRSQLAAVPGVSGIEVARVHDPFCVSYVP